MGVLTRLLIGMVVASLVIAVPVDRAVAVSPVTLAIVNGRPGGAIDVCIDGKEVVSRLRYGRRAFRAIEGGFGVIKVVRTDPRRCKGKLVTREFIVGLLPDDVTIVISGGAPRVTIFDNTGLGTIPPVGSPPAEAFLAWRDASDLGEVNLLLDLMFPDIPIAPQANPVWRKGGQATMSMAPGSSLRLRATRPERTAILAQSRWVAPKAGRRYEWYLVGSRRENARVLVFSRAVSVGGSIL